jgi:hypothetical protein
MYGVLLDVVLVAKCRSVESSVCMFCAMAACVQWVVNECVRCSLCWDVSKLRHLRAAPRVLCSRLGYYPVVYSICPSSLFICM